MVFDELQDCRYGSHRGYKIVLDKADPLGKMGGGAFAI